jgi:hypothetical protein
LLVYGTVDALIAGVSLASWFVAVLRRLARRREAAGSQRLAPA